MAISPLVKLCAAFALATCSCAVAQSAAPERTVRGSTITSQHDPAITIKLPRQAHHLGADRWILFDVADCELHVFVEADSHKQIKKLYWIQFEGYIPSLPDRHHKYPFTQTATLGGLDFDVRTNFGPGDEKPTSGSDLEHVQRIIREKGYTLPQDMMNLRLVHLLDQEARKELMVIYSEDLAPAGVTTSDLMPGGKASAQWPEIRKALTARAEKNITFIPHH